MAAKNQLQILHISDLHIKDDPDESFDRERVLEPLVQRAKEDLQEGFCPEIVVVTGDIAFKGTEAEYALAGPFFDDLMTALGLDTDRLFMVPGNHDVNRKKYRPKDIPVYDTMPELNAELREEEYRRDLLKGMAAYFGFVETRYLHLKPLEDRLVPFVRHYSSSCGRKVHIIGLNSAWMCRRSDDRGAVALGEYQMVRAMEAAKALPEADARLVLLHHPLDWLWAADRNICRSYLENTILLAGHLHEPAGGHTADLEGGFFSFQAGGAYVGTESDYPCRFHYLTLDWGRNVIRLDFRKFAAKIRKWKLDGEIGKDGVREFPMPAPDQPKPEKAAPPLEIPPAYAAWIKDHCQYMDVDHLQVEGQAVRAELPEIFIPLYTHGFDDSKEKSIELERADREPVDIETLLERYPFLLVEGEAGSGKTTLLKHIALCLTQAGYKDFPARGVAGWLPVLIFLKDLRPFFESGSERMLPVTVEEILQYYVRRIGEVLPVDLIGEFIRARRVIFLLDGLDEMAPEHRRELVDAFALFKIRKETKNNKIVLSGRPHGITGTASDKFGQYHAVILRLAPEQVERFIQRWFEYIYSASAGMATKSAAGMISEVRAHPAIDQLIENPLLLTATCILYYAGKTLPGQRAELYDLFINNLLHRRFKEPERVRECLSLLAFRMFAHQRRGADLSLVLEVLGEVHPQKKDESEREHRKRLETLFENIEPRCALLQRGQGEMAFRHLTFQEFLTALYLVETHTDYTKAISKYWQEPRCEEVVALYVGYLSIRNRTWANKVAKEALTQAERDPFHRWRLASRALLDIHPKRRDRDVGDLATEKLRAILETGAAPLHLADAGETLGRLGDRRDLECFIPIAGGKYRLNTGEFKLKPFEISKYPVANQWYAKFIRAGGYETDEFWDEAGLKWRRDKGVLLPRYWNHWRWNCPNSPVVGVSRYEADAFCDWLTRTKGDGRTYALPTEEQWEAAAAGFDQREYPWGDWHEGRCNTRETKIGRMSSVGIFKDGDTPEGVTDLAGNVLEWTSTQVLRGGCWFSTRFSARCASRDRFAPNSRYYFIGFRCVRTK